MDFEVLLLPNWCRLHDSSHSKFACELCHEAVQQVRGKVEQPSTQPTLLVQIEEEDQKPESSDDSSESEPQKDIGTKIKG